jgi:hypothetical protein
MPTPAREDKPPILDYRAASEDRPYATTRATRIVAGLSSALFTAMALYSVFLPHSRSSWAESYAATLVAAAGSVFCLLVAIGIIGRSKGGS